MIKRYWLFIFSVVGVIWIQNLAILDQAFANFLFRLWPILHGYSKTSGVVGVIVVFFLVRQTIPAHDKHHRLACFAGFMPSLLVLNGFFQPERIVHFLPLSGLSADWFY